jgi:hypothetical protein
MALRVTILEYESALEARDLPRLERIWRPTPEQRSELETLFQGEPIEASIDWRSVTYDHDLAIVDFDQVLEIGGKRGPNTSLTAALVPTPGKTWRIVFLGAREPRSPEAEPVEAAEPVATTEEQESIGPLSWTEPGRHTNVASLRAELIKRQGGEWVILRLSPQTADDPLAGSQKATDGESEALHEALRKYELAFESRDVDRLGQIWLMNPYERDLIEELFAWTSLVAISIDTHDVRLDGDRARMDFDQRFVLSARPRVPDLARRAFVRALAASDAAGAWDIRELKR